MITMKASDEKTSWRDFADPITLYARYLKKPASHSDGEWAQVQTAFRLASAGICGYNIEVIGEALRVSRHKSQTSK
jgi:hypothetical protein